MPKKLPQKKIPWYKREIQLGGVKDVDVVMLSKHFAVMLDAGLTVPEALSVLEDQATGSLQKVLNRVLKRVEDGSSLGEAMKLEPKVFSAVFVSSVFIGEESGTLAENFRQLAIQMDKDLTLKRNIKAAMMYPSLVLGLGVVIALGIATFVLPQVANIFTSLRVELPWTTRALIWLSNLFGEYGLILTPSILIGSAFLVWVLRRPVLKSLVDRVSLRLPVMGQILHEINRARFCRTLGTLLDSGVPIMETLEIGARVLPNAVYQHSLQHFQKRIDSGDSLAEIIARYDHLYPKLIQRMVAVGEEAGALGSILKDLAEFYEERVEVKTKNLSTLIEPILLIVIGLSVGLLAMSILTPIYSITSEFSA